MKNLSFMFLISIVIFGCTSTQKENKSRVIKSDTCSPSSSYYYDGANHFSPIACNFTDNYPETITQGFDLSPYEAGHAPSPDPYNVFFFTIPQKSCDNTSRTEHFNGSSDDTHKATFGSTALTGDFNYTCNFDEENLSSTISPQNVPVPAFDSVIDAGANNVSIPAGNLSGTIGETATAQNTSETGTSGSCDTSMCNNLSNTCTNGDSSEGAIMAACYCASACLEENCGDPTDAAQNAALASQIETGYQCPW